MSILDDLKWQYKSGGMAQKLIFVNVAIFIISVFVFYSSSLRVFIYPDWLALNSKWTVFSSTPWTLVSYQFIHSSFLHLFFNMMVLFFAGRLFTTYFTEKQLLGLFISGGIFSGLVYLTAFSLVGKTAQLVGASGSIMAILVASATYAPYMIVRLALIGRVKLWQIAVVLVVLDLVQIPIENSGGHLAHLGGALFGFIFVKLLERDIDLSLWITKVITFFETLFSKKQKTPFKKVHKNKTPTFTTATNEVHQKKVDEILDKISKSGYDSLTKDEKEFLFKSEK